MPVRSHIKCDADKKYVYSVTHKICFYKNGRESAVNRALDGSTYPG